MTDPYNTATVATLPDKLNWEEPDLSDTQRIRIALFVNRETEDSQGERYDKSRILENKNN